VGKTKEYASKEKHNTKIIVYTGHAMETFRLKKTAWPRALPGAEESVFDVTHVFGHATEVRRQPAPATLPRWQCTIARLTKGLRIFGDLSGGSDRAQGPTSIKTARDVFGPVMSALKGRGQPPVMTESSIVKATPAGFAGLSSLSRLKV
jgi:hypothetical protein